MHGIQNEESWLIVPWSVNPKELTLPSMRTIILLTERTAEGPAAVPASVDQPWQPLIAGQADWFRVVVWTNCSRDVGKQNFPSWNITSCHEQPSTSFFIQNAVWKTLVVITVSIFQLTCGGAVGSWRAGLARKSRPWLGTHHTRTVCHIGALLWFIKNLVIQYVIFLQNNCFRFKLVNI